MLKVMTLGKAKQQICDCKVKFHYLLTSRVSV